MTKYNLQPNESFVLNSEYVCHSNTNGELILTNLNLVFITSRGVFKTTYIPQIYPLKQIKVYNGNAQVILGKDGNMDIHFKYGQETFKFWNNDTLFKDKKAEYEASRWVNAINQVITGQGSDIDSSASPALANVEVIAGTIKDSFNTFKGALGIKPKSNNEIPTMAARKCNYCGAPISGTQGQIIRCQYCDADQQL